jgi:hypothetical protein
MPCKALHLTGIATFVSRDHRSSGGIAHCLALKTTSIRSDGLHPMISWLASVAGLNCGERSCHAEHEGVVRGKTILASQPRGRDFPFKYRVCRPVGALHFLLNR